SPATATSKPARSRYIRTRPAILVSSSTTSTRSRVLTVALTVGMGLNDRGPAFSSSPRPRILSGDGCGRDRTAKILCRLAFDGDVAAGFGRHHCRPRGQQVRRYVEVHSED